MIALGKNLSFRSAITAVTTVVYDAAFEDPQVKRVEDSAFSVNLGILRGPPTPGTEVTLRARRRIAVFISLTRTLGTAESAA